MNPLIQEKAMVVRLKVGFWTCRKVDSKATSDVIRKAGAQTDAGKFRKNLIPVEEIKKIRRAIAHVRKEFKFLTLPWLDDGERMLPSEQHMDFTAKMRKAKNGFERAKEQFLKDYDANVKRAKSILGDMFDENDYPPVATLSEKFYVTLNIGGVPSGDDFRVNLGERVTAEIREDIERRVNEQVMVGVKDIWVRLKEAVQHMTEKLTDKDAIFRDTLVGNLKGLCEVLPKLNVVGDKEFDRVIGEVKDLISNVRPEELRKDEKKRKATATKANAILDKMKGYGI